MLSPSLFSFNLIDHGPSLMVGEGRITWRGHGGGK